MSGFDFTTLTSLIPETVNDMSDLIKQEVFESEDLQKNVTIVDGIKFNKKIGYLTKMNDIGLKAHATACDINEIAATVGTKEKEWVPRPYDSRIKICAETLHPGLVTTAINAGVKRNDIDNTVLGNLFLDYLKKAMVEMFNRMTWISELNAARFGDSPAGTFSDEIDVHGTSTALNLNLVNMQNGFFWKIAHVMSTNPDQLISLTAENDTPSTYAAQVAAMTKVRALEIAEQITSKMPLDLNIQGKKVICTRDFYFALRSNFQGFALESTKTNLEQGLGEVRVNGVVFEWWPELDYMARKFQWNGAKVHKLHRAIIFDKSNFMLGVPDISKWGEMEAWYEKKDRQYYIDIKDEFDVVIAQDRQIGIAI